MGGTDFHTKAVADDLIGYCNKSGCLGSHSHQMKVHTERTGKEGAGGSDRKCFDHMPSMMAMLPMSLILSEWR